MTRSPSHPAGRFLGDLLVRQPSAYGRGGWSLFPGADELHLPATGHLDLLNRALQEQRDPSGDAELDETRLFDAFERLAGGQGQLQALLRAHLISAFELRHPQVILELDHVGRFVCCPA